jgi:hypothetical protein
VCLILRSLGKQGLVRQLHDSADPLWELLLFEARSASEHDEELRQIVQDRILAHDR